MKTKQSDLQEVTSQNSDLQDITPDLPYPPEFSNPPDRQQIKETAMLSAGVTRAKLYEKIFEGINASKKITDSDEMGNPVLREEPDLIVRHKYIETALRVLGDLKPDSVVDNSKTFNLTVNERKSLTTRLQDIMGHVVPDQPSGAGNVPGAGGYAH